MTNNNNELSPRLQDAGVFLFRRLLNDARSQTTNTGIPSLTAVIQNVRNVIRHAPLFTPRMYDGKPFRYQMSNCGDLGWLATPAPTECQVRPKKGYYYSDINPYTGQPWPHMPDSIRTTSILAATDTGWTNFNPETCLINFYRNQNDRLGIHQDNSEKNLSAPVVSISIGDSAIFQIGGTEKTTPVEDILLENGDVLVLAHKSRLFYHKLARILPGSSNQLTFGGRLNLTIRQVN
jgi:alkylated DNA repair protein (DNA oxidative demethylase)